MRLIRQVWQGWWELVNVETGEVILRSWNEEDVRALLSKGGE